MFAFLDVASSLRLASPERRALFVPSRDPFEFQIFDDRADERIDPAECLASIRLDRDVTEFQRSGVEPFG